MADDLKPQGNNVLQGSESNDIISSLHDSILHHILSFLPTSDVVRTGILSQRWKSLWIGVSIFDISDFRSPNTACWNFVERALLLRNGSSIEQFKLRFALYAMSSYSRVQTMISSLVSHKIQHLDISLCVEDQFTLPCSVFECQSLRILKLSILKVLKRRKLILELPDHMSLPCLKVMHLRFCEFQNANSIEKLFSCSPVLEELALVDCKWIHLNSITISIPSLKRLTMGAKFSDDLFDDDDSICYITIEAPALLSFNYTGVLTNRFYLTKISSSSSMKACIHITNCCYDREETRGRRLFKLLQVLENMVSLTISNEAEEVFSFRDKLSDHLPVFHHLEYLDFNMNLKDHDLKGLLKFFYFTPKLGTIRFSKGVDETIRKAGNFMRKSLPNCFSSSLKILCLEKFHGLSYEFSFLNNFLDKAVSLQKINIFLAKDINQRRLRENLEKLSARFKHCAINIVE